MNNKKFRAAMFSIMPAILFMLSSNYGLAVEDFPKGEVIGQVFCRADLKQNYTLFLPSNYTPDQKWPIVYCFDPAARGRLPVEHFKDAANMHGYILAGVNNSRNGPLEQSLYALNAVWKDTQERLSVDEKRVYIAGLSGGARIANVISSLCKGCVAGVIACGAGFHLKMAPAKDLPFVFFGTIGTDDFNFSEFRDLKEELNKKGVANRIAVFEGGHVWPPHDVCVRAFEWLDIQAIKKGTREKDEALIDRIFAKRLEQVRGYERSGKAYDVYAGYDALAADFKGLRGVTEFEKEAARLRKTPQVEKYIKEERVEAQKQKALEEEIIDLTDMLKTSENAAGAMGHLRTRIMRIKKDAEEAEDSGKRRIARRALTHLFEVFYEMGAIIHAKDYVVSVANLEIAIEINPDDARAQYGLACAYSMKGQKKKAIAALKKAVGKGFTNIAYIESTKELDPLREETEYKLLIEKIRGR